MSIAIKVNNVSKVYKLYKNKTDRVKEHFNPFKKIYHKKFYALNNINLTIMKGECVGIIGENGSGKSTLLKIISGVTKSYNGSIHINGRVSAILELGAGFNPELNGVENIFFKGALLGYSHKQMKQKLDQIINFADIGDYIYQPVKLYSSGMFARLAFAVAINVEPDILIIDEVLSVGDVAFQRKCFAKIESFQKQGKTILFVSHSLGSVIELCSRAILLDRGEIILDGEPRFVVNNYCKLINTKTNRAELRNNLKKAMLANNTAGHSTTTSPARAISDYSKDLQPQTSTAYGDKDIEIFDICILDEKQNKIVNRLYSDCHYIYSYKVKFNENLDGVKFGMLIKTLKGFELGGASYPQADEEINVRNGDVYHVRFRFRCILELGHYLTNCGVRYLDNGQEKIAKRILDAYLFEVLPRPNRLTTGIINFQIQPEVNLIRSDD